MLKSALDEFLLRPLEYRVQFAQKNYGLDKVGFDGYSFPGQTDSVNQAYDDHLHSMVFSEFLTADAYPEEFCEYLTSYFLDTVRAIKKAIDLTNLEVELGLKDCLGISASINYYPKMDSMAKTEGPRLTQHVDGSLLTLFPYGLEQGLYYEKQGSWIEWPANDKALCFPGYMSTLLDINVMPLNHKLNWVNEQEDRYAFAFFVVPKPASMFIDKHGRNLSAFDYYQKYLALFD